ncbi:hypothetical protein BRADI_4g29006v3 [Brachypodium distachyon]|uniref:Uncharacterized protein n=1 Tax=Brachypodium distachyon TaxID=15368 RepID=A0A0Q3EUR5_BRADI|nr:hypothetical protein BRADI_4g29006v3 [Brachypodium distachyon]
MSPSLRTDSAIFFLPNSLRGPFLSSPILVSSRVPPSAVTRRQVRAPPSPVGSYDTGRLSAITSAFALLFRGAVAADSSSGRRFRPQAEPPRIRPQAVSPPPHEAPAAADSKSPPLLNSFPSRWSAAP